MKALQKLDLAIELLGDRALFFCFFLRNLSILKDRDYWLQIREIPKFQAKVSISMILRKVIEPTTVVDLDS
jgi:hypothetical protein